MHSGIVIRRTDRADAHDRADPVRVFCGKRISHLGAVGESDNGGPIRASGVEHCYRIADILAEQMVPDLPGWLLWPWPRWSSDSRR